MIKNMEQNFITTDYFWKTHKKFARALYEIVPQIAERAIDDLIENNLKPCIAETIIEDHDAFRFERKFKKPSTSNTSCRDDAFQSQHHNDHQDDDAPLDGEKRVKRQKTSKSLKSVRGSSSKDQSKISQLMCPSNNNNKKNGMHGMDATLNDMLSNQFKNAEEYTYHLEQATNFMENQIVWESRQKDIRRPIPRPPIFFGPKRNLNEPPRCKPIPRPMGQFCKNYKYLFHPMEEVRFDRCVDSDTHPPMLDKFDFESWKQRIHLYCLDKENRENILKSVDEGPFKMGKFRETFLEGALHLGKERDRVFADLTLEENERFKADIHAKNILLQGLPKDIYTLINHYIDAKYIWDNVKMLLEGSELVKDKRGQTNTFDDDVDEAPTMFMENLSLADPIYDDAIPSYDSYILSEVKDHDNYLDSAGEYHEVHEMQNDVQLNYVVDSDVEYTCDSNIILYEQYVMENAMQVIQSNVSSVPNDALMMIINDMHEQAAQCVSVNEQNKVVNVSLTAELARYKELVEPYFFSCFDTTEGRYNNGHEIVKTKHAPTIVHDSEDTLEIAEITRKRMLEKVKSPLCVEKKVKFAPLDYSKENYLATFTPPRHLTPKQIFWSSDIAKMTPKPILAMRVYLPYTPARLVPRVLPPKSQVKDNIYTLTQLFLEFNKTCKKRITPCGLIEKERVSNKQGNVTLLR
nr:integrase, catalytic region, zinc finger, CCHC-type, peptidase aspartic, catalytic [Tanacetum cinerariifolium]